MMHSTPFVHASRERRGATLIAAVVVVIVLGMIALCFLNVATRTFGEHEQAKIETRAFYAAEAGLSDAFVDMSEGGAGVLGSSDAPIAFGGLSYWVEVGDLGDGVRSLVATGLDGEVQARVELVVQPDEIEVTDFGIFGEVFLRLASNTFVDSYDSSDGSYASQLSGDHALEYCNIGSNDDIKLDSGVDVYGYAQYGPDADDSISFASGATVSDGYGAAQQPIILDPIVVPSSTDLGSTIVNGGEVRVIASGTYHYSALTLQSGSLLRVEGPATLILDDCLVSANSTWVLDASGGPIDVYATGDFELKSNSSVSTPSQDASQVRLWLSGTHTSLSDSSPAISFNSNSEFYGSVYAPDLSTTISSNFELFGSIKSQWLTLASNARIHYDQTLSVDGSLGFADLRVISWRPLPGALQASE